MPLSEEIKSQIDRTVQSGRSDINLSNDVFLGDDVQELVDLLNTHKTITEVNLSRNTLIQKDVEAESIKACQSVDSHYERYQL